MQGLDTFSAKSRVEKIGGDALLLRAQSAVLPQAAHDLSVCSEMAVVSRKDRRQGKEDMSLVSLQALPLLSDNHKQNTPLSKTG